MANKDVDPGMCPAWKIHSSTKFYDSIDNFTLCFGSVITEHIILNTEINKKRRNCLFLI